MPKPKKITVELPNMTRSVELSPSLALTLQLIIFWSDRGGVNTFQLIEAGLLSVSNSVSLLRKAGAIINTELKTVENNFDFIGNKGVTHYTYKGWI